MPSHFGIPPVSPVPPWESIDNYLLDEFMEDTPKHLCDTVAQQLFNEKIYTKYNDFVHVYTDGSKTENNVSSGIVIPQFQYSKGYKIHPCCSILYAELFGILKAIEYLRENHINKSIIFTDSLSSIYLLRSRNVDSYKEIVYLIQEYLQRANQNGDALIYWIPGHKGIPGNESADQVAKNAENDDASQRVRLSYEEKIKVLKKTTIHCWQQYWDNMLQATNTGNFLKSIKNNIQYWGWANNKSRILETSLSKLRVGHVGLAQHLHRFGMKDSPFCQCGEIETIKHFMIDCNLYVQFRDQMKIDLQSLNLNMVFDLKLLLGGADCSEREQKQIVKLVGRYLTQTGRLIEL